MNSNPGLSELQSDELDIDQLEEELRLGEDHRATSKTAAVEQKNSLAAQMLR